MGEKFKNFLKKAWHFLWEEDSLLSLLANIAVAFILIKFIVYPGLGLILGTNYPVVAVVSGSMEHDGSFDEWWQSKAYCNGICTQEQWYLQDNITKETFREYLFKNGFNKGDIMVLKGIKPKNIKRGDVIVFQKQSNKEPIIHRVIRIAEIDEGSVFETKGDHNQGSGDIDKDIRESDLIGKAVFKIPFLGWVKIVFTEAVQAVLSLFR